MAIARRWYGARHDMAQTWRSLALVYRATDARWRPPASLRRRRSRRVMSEQELEAKLAALERVPRSVDEWSGGSARLAPFDVRVIERPIASLSSVGSAGFWVAPDDIRPELDRLAPTDRYDALFALWPSDGRVPLCGWGCTWGPSSSANGAGFSSITTDHWRIDGALPDPEEGFVHEWLHQVEATYRSLGAGEDVFPSLHDAETLTSCRPESEPPHGRTYRWWHDNKPDGTSWRTWYEDYMTGQIRRPNGDGCFGISPEVWALRR
jgi:hypothetical protein